MNQGYSVSPKLSKVCYQLPLLGFALIALCLFSLTRGSVAISFDRVVGVLLAAGQGGGDPVESAIIWSLRLPRVLLGVLLGASLAGAGALLQGLFRNPLADPALLGISAGGAVGALAALLLAGSLGMAGIGGASWFVPASAAFGALLTSRIVFLAASCHGRLDVSTMLLAGIAINALAGSLLGLGVSFANDAQLRAFTFWTLGSLAQASWEHTLIGALFMLPALAIVPLFAQRLNVLQLGEPQAACLGLNVAGLRRILIALSALLAGSSVALCGIVGFVGLLAPHVVRLILGGDHRRLLPAALLAGSTLTVSADLLARTALAPAELPLGALTALAGGPLFLALILRPKNAA